VFGWIEQRESIYRDDISGDVISQDVNPAVDFSGVDFPGEVNLIKTLLSSYI